MTCAVVEECCPRQKTHENLVNKQATARDMGAIKGNLRDQFTVSTAERIENTKLFCTTGTEYKIAIFYKVC